MQVQVVKIGNSKGIRIPKKVLNQCQVEDILELTIQDNIIMLVPVHKKTREGWAEAIAAIQAKHGAETLDQTWLNADLLGHADMEDWEW